MRGDKDDLRFLESVLERIEDLYTQSITYEQYYGCSYENFLEEVNSSDDKDVVEEWSRILRSLKYALERRDRVEAYVYS